MINLKSLGYAADGLQQIRSLLLYRQDFPSLLEVPQYLIRFFQLSKQKYPSQTITSKHNIVLLIKWIIDQIAEYNPTFFEFDPSELNLVLYLLKMMEINQLVKLFNTPYAKDFDQQISNTFKKMLQQSIKKGQEYCLKIKQHICTVISQNTIKTLESLLKMKQEIIENTQLISSPLIQIKLSCVCINLLLNLRRRIRLIWGIRESQLEALLKPIKLLELKLYYLSIATFSATETYTLQLSSNIFNPDRKVTYSYLLHDERGLYKINHYFQQAPINQIENEIKLITSILNKKHALHPSITCISQEEI